MIFSGEAYNVEQGVSNEVFPNKRYPGGSSTAAVTACTFNATPEDTTNIFNPDNANLTRRHGLGDVFRRDQLRGVRHLLAPPASHIHSLPSEQNGQKLFTSVGCSLCHSTSLTSGLTNYPALSNYIYHPFSDFALHHMGSNLADGISQGVATGTSSARLRCGARPAAVLPARWARRRSADGHPSSRHGSLHATSAPRRSSQPAATTAVVCVRDSLGSQQSNRPIHGARSRATAGRPELSQIALVRHRATNWQYLHPIQ